MKTWMHMTLQSVFMVEKKSSCEKKNLRVFHISFDKIISKPTAGIFGQHKALGPTVHHTEWKAHFDWQLLTVTLCSSQADRFGPGTVQSVEEFLLRCHVMFYSYTVQKLVFLTPGQTNWLIDFCFILLWWNVLRPIKTSPCMSPCS